MTYPKGQQHIKNLMTATADTILDTHDIKKDYTEEDLIHSLQIFTEVLINKTYDYQCAFLTQEQMQLAVEELGKNLRQTVKLATGIDPHEAVKRVYNIK